MSQARQPRIRLLLVEGDPRDAGLVHKRLAREDVSVSSVATLQAARKALRAPFPDVILVDLGLPDSQGVESFTALREAAPHTPIVVLAAHQDEAAGLEAVRQGAEDLVGKSNLQLVPLGRILKYAIERRRLHEQLRSMVWKDADAMVVLGGQGELLAANPAAESLFGRPADQLMGSVLEIPSQDGAATELQVRRPDGGTIQADVRVTATSWEGQEAWLASICDPSERSRVERAERAQRESERRLRLLLDQLPVALWTSGNELEFDWCATGRSQLLAGDSARYLGRPLREVFGAAEAAKLIEAHREARELGEARCEFASRERHYECRVRVGERNGSAAPELVGIAFDVTERVCLEEQLWRAQKMEAVGQLAGGVAHDFANILTVIASFTSFAMQGLPSDQRARADLSQVLSAVGRAERLTNQLLAFSRRQTIAPAVLNANELIEGLRDMLRRLLGEDITLRIDLEQEPWNIRIDPGMFEQVMINLAVNARDAMPQGGVLTLKTENTTASPRAQRAGGAEALAGDYFDVSVTDTGVGMDAGTSARVFEPFFTTKAPDRGTGLGLSTCYGIVKQAQGHISVRSTPAEGACFHIYLPRVREEPARRRSSQPPLVLRGSEVVLVVEDEAQVREVAARALQQLGYQVLTADGPVQALRVCQEHAGSVDLLLTDLVMPGLDGRELARRVLARHPQARVLYVSGYTRDAIADRTTLEPGADLLQKPFTPDALARRVREVLTASPPPSG